MILQLNLAAIVAVASQATWRKVRPAIVQEAVWLPCALFVGGCGSRSDQGVSRHDCAAASDGGECSHRGNAGRSHSIWLMTQAARWGQIKGIPANAHEVAEKSWNTEIYRRTRDSQAGSRADDGVSKLFAVAVVNRSRKHSVSGR